MGRGSQRYILYHSFAHNRAQSVWHTAANVSIETLGQTIPGIDMSKRATVIQVLESFLEDTAALTFLLTSTKWMDLFPLKISYSDPVLCCSVLSNSATLRTLACQGPLSMGILQARILEWVAMPSSRFRSCNCSYCVYKNLRSSWASQVVLLVKNLPANAGDIRDIRGKVWSLGQEDPLEEDMATHSSILAWRVP